MHVCCILHIVCISVKGWVFIPHCDSFLSLPPAKLLNHQSLTFRIFHLDQDGRHGNAEGLRVTEVRQWWNRRGFKQHKAVKRGIKQHELGFHRPKRGLNDVMN